MTASRLTTNVVLVDTDVYSYFLNGKPIAEAYQKHVDGKLTAVSYITIGELYHGAVKAKWGPSRFEALEASLEPVIKLPFDIEVCRAYATIRSALERSGTRLDDHDLWIAACAIRHSIPLVSNNRSHFERVPGLILRSEAAPTRNNRR